MMLCDSAYRCVEQDELPPQLGVVHAQLLVEVLGEAPQTQPDDAGTVLLRYITASTHKGTNVRSIGYLKSDPDSLRAPGVPTT